jgi:hypothetical protein
MIIQRLRKRTESMNETTRPEGLENARSVDRSKGFESTSSVKYDKWQDGRNEITLPAKDYQEYWQKFKGDTEAKKRGLVVVKEGKFPLSPTRSNEVMAIERAGHLKAIVKKSGKGMDTEYKVMPGDECKGHPINSCIPDEED